MRRTETSMLAGVLTGAACAMAALQLSARTVAEWPLGCDEKVCPVKNNVFQRDAPDAADPSKNRPRGTSCRKACGEC